MRTTARSSSSTTRSPTPPSSEHGGARASSSLSLPRPLFSRSGVRFVTARSAGGAGEPCPCRGQKGARLPRPSSCPPPAADGPISLIYQPGAEWRFVFHGGVHWRGRSVRAASGERSMDSECSERAVLYEDWIPSAQDGGQSGHHRPLQTRPTTDRALGLTASIHEFRGRLHALAGVRGAW